MIRISSGIAKNKKIEAPEIAGFRSVQEIAKNSIFSILGDTTLDAICLDLFAGSGNLGLEALSRGAAWCDFVDENPESYNAIAKNIINCGFFEKSQNIRKDAVKFVSGTDKLYDLIFLDPFYDTTSHIFLFKQLKRVLALSGHIIYLYSPQTKIDTIINDSDLVVITTRKFGKSAFSVIKHR